MADIYSWIGTSGGLWGWLELGECRDCDQPGGAQPGSLNAVAIADATPEMITGGTDAASLGLPGLALS
jgi:hypothetical protein